MCGVSEEAVMRQGSWSGAPLREEKEVTGARAPARSRRQGAPAKLAKKTRYSTTHSPGLSGTGSAPRSQAWWGGGAPFFHT